MSSLTINLLNAFFLRTDVLFVLVGLLLNVSRTLSSVSDPHVPSLLRPSVSLQ